MESSDGIQWNRVPSEGSIESRFGHQTLVYNDALWVLGGSFLIGDIKNDVWHSTDGANWNQVLTNNHPQWSLREFHESFVFDNAMWILGGYDGTIHHNDIWKSSDGTNWQEITVTGDHWFPRREHEAFVYKDEMWVIGGLDHRISYDDVWRSSDGRNWQKVPRFVYE